MRTLRYYTKASEVVTLCEMLYNLGFNVKILDSFTLEVDAAVKQFQRNNNLVVDGIVGPKTWQKLYEKCPQVIQQNDKLLSEADLIDFANYFGLELALVKAVNEIESGGKGFLINGKPVILFEGHVFWRELQKRGINPRMHATESNRDVLYETWTRNYYLGGIREYDRLNKAIGILNTASAKEAALSSASWGAFQIMGFHAKSLGYPSVDDFVAKMNLHEREHLHAFGQFLKVNGLIPLLAEKQWADFAERYNGKNYKINQYDIKLEKAYQKYRR